MERQGESTVVMPSKRRSLLKEWEQLTQEVSTHNEDLSPEQADQWANKVIREAINDMVEEGSINFKQP